MIPFFQHNKELKHLIVLFSLTSFGYLVLNKQNMMYVLAQGLHETEGVELPRVKHSKRGSIWCLTLSSCAFIVNLLLADCYWTLT